MQTNQESDWYTDPLGIGSISQLNDQPCDTPKRIPLGFPIPKGEPMTPYRDRLNAGEYQDKNTPADKPKRKTKRAQAKRTKK